ncbi:sushi, von Willebrand factor type A, EGF and pentraxin domain-containing protein 1-like isoform X1 [Rhynchophorus ferrugineus]|uniref:sushi, von Willebrand factor type A, EGF and pentraxin domain-containing protein 1-like isoform X1 n=1 Tax=Rhynchophorus ferrugineus TaxID=354439 RepID=UPI003FCE37DC
MNLPIHLFWLLMYLVVGGPCATVSQKFDLDVLNNYSEFLNLGRKKLQKIKGGENLENAIFKSKLEILGEIFKTNVDFIRSFKRQDIVFLVDASSSVGRDNFKSELRFIKKLLSGITVDYNHTRVAVITFSSPSNTVVNIDEISVPSKENNKCLLLNNQLMNIEYKGGETYTFGAFEKAKEVFELSKRPDARKVLFLITDGYSTGASPVPISTELKNQHVTVFTIGIRNGNYKELYELSSTPGEFYSYLLDSFEEFESLARRALHVDLSAGDYIPLGFSTPCDKLCDGGDCCDEKALCSCGTTTGHYSCICQPGYYGNGLRNNCLPCIPGTYGDGPNLCLPCPDVHHTTIAPAFGIESCVCKRGFQSDKRGGCRVLKCPKISPPEHGYIVKKKECSNVLNSACGIRCEVGYTLSGSSIRLCQDDAKWSGSNPTCEVKTCSRPPVPKYGTIRCEHADLDLVYDADEQNFPVDTVCKMDCKGNLLIGSSQRTCLPIAQWDGLRTICKPIKCNKISPIKYGTIVPESCTQSKQEFGKKCTIKCKKGFETDDKPDLVCGKSGLWNGKRKETTCVDTSPPDLTCPKNVTVKAETGTKYGLASWETPNVTDNSGLNVTVWMKPSMKNITNHKFSIGLNRVSYYARDAFQNIIKCAFFVEVLDEEPPTIEDCNSPPPFLTNSKVGENITWDEPNIYDNSQNVSVNKSHHFGFFPVGTTLISYIAEDPSGNINICYMNITVESSRCPEFFDPVNGETNCTDLENGVQCVVTCQEGYAIPFPVFSETDINSTSFTCNHADFSWHGNDAVIFPDCSITALPKEEINEGDLNVTLENVMCNDTNKIQEVSQQEHNPSMILVLRWFQIENDLKSTLENNICTGNCTTNLRSQCQVEEDEETTNQISSTKRRRRTATRELKQKVGEASLKTGQKRRKNRKRLNIKFQVRGKVKDSAQLTNVTLAGMVSGKIVLKTTLVCSDGFISRRNRCVQCPKGTFHNKTSNICQSCDFGFYNDQMGQKSCTQCPEKYTTTKQHAKRSKDCREMCPPGTHARRKKVRINRQHRNSTVERSTLRPYCRSCPVGTYQSNYGQLKCLPCPKGHTTVGTRSVNASQCLPTAQEICSRRPNVCRNGNCIIVNDYESSCQCSPPYYGPHCENTASPCDSNPCLNGGSCSSTDNHQFKCSCLDGYSGSYCEELLEKEGSCQLDCQNGGTCVHIEDNEYVCACKDGFSGDTCEKKFNSCDNVLCENNGTCIEQGSTYKCVCPRGYLGRRCHLVPCDYQPCSTNTICINLDIDNITKSDYRCLCPDGYTGQKCDEIIDYCTSKPCLNGGTCTNEETTYSCSCSKLFYGPECQYIRDVKYMLKFPRYDVNDFIRFRGFQTNLSEITACLWIQTTDNFNYGTLLSYATHYSDNVFTLTDYTGLIFYVNNDHVETDVFLNDGNWHHICASWKSLEGKYYIYVDGNLMTSGTDLAANTKIEGHGYLVVGQEQDVLGGKFSQAESFTGNMAYIDIWSKSLNESEVLDHLNDCSGKIYGDLYAWPEMQENIIGNIQKLNSTFCQKCKEPQDVHNGLIDVVDNVAFYSCREGYELTIKKFGQGRKCTKVSRWEELREPTCRKIHCGYPGFVKNAYSIGNRFFYNDKVIYRCFDDYNMVGDEAITCNSQGKWVPAKPRCLAVQCTMPIIKHGVIKIINDDTLENSEEKLTSVDSDTAIKIECFSNATLTGIDVLICLENGTWSDNSSCVLNQPEPTEPPKSNRSKLSCSLNQIPAPPSNGFTDENSLRAVENGSSDTVIYKCKPGHKLKGIGLSTCIIDGYWTEPNMSCQPIQCPKVPTFKNMSLKKQSAAIKPYQFGNVLHYECDEGHKMLGPGTLRCTMLGKWSKMQSRCTRKSCGKPQVSSTVEIQGDSYLFGDTISVSCSDGQTYELTCGKNGSWIGELDADC